MPTKQELETINDELLTANDRLQHEQSAQAQRLAALSENLAAITARLEALASRPPQRTPNHQSASSRDELAAQIEPLVIGLNALLAHAKLELIEQNKRALILQALVQRNEQTTGEFLHSLRQAQQHAAAAEWHTDRLGQYLDRWQGQPRLTMLKVTGAMFGSTILAGLLIGCLVLWRLQPTQTMQADAMKWRVLTEELPPEQLRQLEQAIETKLSQRQQSGQSGAQPSGANEATTNANSTPMSSSPTPPTDRRNRR